ncbi:MAG: response regulator transcription factor [Caldilineaceae bacterium]
MSPINILIVDDHKLFRHGLRTICETRGFRVVGEASNGYEAVQQACRLQPNVILMDLGMPGLNGIQATQQILAYHPHIRVIALTMFIENCHIVDAVHAGVSGYLLKNSDPDVLVTAIETVARGDALIDPSMTAKLLSEFRRIDLPPLPDDDAEPLTPAEMEVLTLVAKGEDNQEIADILCLSQRTVSNRLSVIYEKLNVKNRTQAALYALKRGWVSLE